MKNVLMIAYHFPPIGGVGTQRTVKFAKYLPQFGWRPIILTVDKRADRIENADTSFFQELSSDVKIYRSRIIEPHDVYRFFGGRLRQGSRKSRILHQRYDGATTLNRIRSILFSLLLPDSKFAWYPTAIQKARKIFKEREIDVIFSTSPKPTAHAIAKHLSQKYVKPWVADFRDPWFADYASPIKRPKLVIKIDKRIEKSVLWKAQRITVATEGILEDFISNHKNFDEKKAVIITNGYDEEDFIGIQPKCFKKFTISYAGTFYKNNQPDALLKALKKMIEEQPHLREEILVQFIGIADPVLFQLIKKYNLYDVVKHIPYVPHKECISYLLGSHLLFLNTIGNALTGKLFDYLGSGTPILALVSENSQIAHILSETKTGVAINPNETDKIKNFIISKYNNYKVTNALTCNADREFPKKFLRKALTSKRKKASV
jgi:glycosyltransferase involved in cell wall biosynthesis